MKNNLHPAYMPFVPQQDTALNILRPAVDVPQDIELKVERPKIKVLSEEDTVHARTEQEQIREVTTKVTEEPEKTGTQPAQANYPDTLDYILISDWKSSGFAKQLWSSASNDSVCLLQSVMKSGNIVEHEEGREETKEVIAETKSDTAVFGKKTIEALKETTPVGEEKLPTSQEQNSDLLSVTWFITTIIIMVAVTGIIRFRWQKYLTNVFNAIAFTNVANTLQSTSSRSEKPASIWLGFLFYANFSLFLYEFMILTDRSFFDISGWKLWLTLFGFLLVIFTLKIIVYQFIGWVFRVQDRTKEYLSQSSVMSKAYGVILLPLIALFPFLEPETRHFVPKIGFSVFILLYLIQIARGIQANLRDALSGYYIILYLCALEILPLSILYKVLFY
ncbi:MAG: hypothetical protein PWR04_1228 [Anaerophaga sp.]|nr:hypothetical protein [Anaerophaga sp.]